MGSILRNGTERNEGSRSHPLTEATALFLIHEKKVSSVLQRNFQHLLQTCKTTQLTVTEKQAYVSMLRTIDYVRKISCIYKYVSKHILLI